MTASLPPVLTTLLAEMTALRTASRVARVNALTPALAKCGPMRLEQLEQKVFAAQSEMGEGKLPWEVLLHEKAAVDDLFRWHSCAQRRACVHNNSKGRRGKLEISNLNARCLSLCSLFSSGPSHACTGSFDTLSKIPQAVRGAETSLQLIHSAADSGKMLCS